MFKRNRVLVKKSSFTIKFAKVNVKFQISKKSLTFEIIEIIKKLFVSFKFRVEQLFRFLLCAFNFHFYRTFGLL
jgi:hypothetical protein